MKMIEIDGNYFRLDQVQCVEKRKECDWPTTYWVYLVGGKKIEIDNGVYLNLTKEMNRAINLGEL